VILRVAYRRGDGAPTIARASQSCPRGSIAIPGSPSALDSPLVTTDDLEATRFSRRRSGASAWRIWQDGADPNRVVEQFVVASWEEHLRQHGTGDPLAIKTASTRSEPSPTNRRSRRSPTGSHLGQGRDLTEAAIETATRDGRDVHSTPSPKNGFCGLSANGRSASNPG
jgi:hypothetical protein